MRPKIWPQQIETSWRRFSSGLWGIPSGDIIEAYSADTFPKVKTFREAGQLYTNCGIGYSRFFHAYANCHPLIPEADYQGPDRVERGYEGRKAIFSRQNFRLGPQVVFVSSEPSPTECRNLLRILYTEGGWFARHDTYGEFLQSLGEPSGNEIEARKLELDGALAALQKEALRSWLENGNSSSGLTQLDLAL